MSYGEDLLAAKQLQKEDTHPQLRTESNGVVSYASWIRAGQSLSYYVWNDSETALHEEELKLKYLSNGRVLTVKSAVGYVSNIDSVMNHFSQILNVGVAVHVGSPASSSPDSYGYQQADLLFASAEITGNADLLANTFASVPKQSDGRTGTAIFIGDSMNAGADSMLEHTLRHEVLHGIGLYDAHIVLVGTKYDSLKYTATSYNSHSGFDSNAFGSFNLPKVVFPTSLMLLDYLALQEKGLLSAYQTGDDTYHWAKDEKVLHTIYDTGGKDVISAQDHERNTIIDLRQGHFSSYGKSDKGDEVPVENLAIAYGTIIENAIGGNGNDVLIGNDTGNELTGGKGNDILTGGGAPLNTDDWQFILKNGAVYLPMIDNAAGSATDNDTLIGGEGNDYLYGIAGNDKLDGGEGHDNLWGGEGDDILIGGKGVDKLEGGNGKDTYILDGDFGRDIIVDSDGKGTVVIDGVTLGELKPVQGTDNVFRFGSNIEVIRFEEGKTTSLYISTRPTATSPGSSVMIKNWQPGQLGITIGDLDEDPSITGVKAFNGDAAGNVLSMDHALYVYEDDPTRNSWRHLQADGGAGQDFLMGTLSGNDTLKGGDDDDLILGGSVILGETNVRLLSNLDNHGTDDIDGGNGSDYIVVTGKNSVVHGGDDSDFIRADSFMTASFSGVLGYEDDKRIVVVTADQVWQDYRQNLFPHFTETQNNGVPTFDLSLKDETKNNLEWVIQPSVSGKSSYMLQRPINNVSDDTVLITAYGEHPPTIEMSVTSSVGAWYVADSSVAGKMIGASYLAEASLNIAQYQDMKGHNLSGDKGDGGVDSDTIYCNDGDDLLLSEIGDELNYMTKIYYSGGAANDNIFTMQKLAC